MSGRLKNAYLLVSAALIAALLLTGCSKISDALSGVGATPAPTSAAVTPTEAVSPAPDAEENPVFGFVGGFIADYEKASRGLFDAVYGSGAETDGLLSLQRDEALAASLRSTVGMLPVGGDGGLFGGSVTGPYAGTGGINAKGSFNYAFETGGSISGRIENGSLLRARIVSDGETADIALSYTGGRWLLLIVRGDEAEFLEISGSSLRFARTGSGAHALSEPTVFPDTGAVLVYGDGKLG